MPNICINNWPIWQQFKTVFLNVCPTYSTPSKMLKSTVLLSPPVMRSTPHTSASWTSHGKLATGKALSLCPSRSRAWGPGTRVQWLKLWSWGARWPARLVMRRAPQSSAFSSSCPCLWCGEMRLSWTTATLKGVMMMLPGESLIPPVPVICKYLQTFALFVVDPS